MSAGIVEHGAPVWSVGIVHSIMLMPVPRVRLPKHESRSAKHVGSHSALVAQYGGVTGRHEPSPVVGPISLQLFAPSRQVVVDRPGTTLSVAQFDCDPTAPGYL